MPNPNYITTLKNDDKTSDLTPRTTIPAIYDSDLQYLNSNLKAPDLNALQDGEVGKLEGNFAQIEVSPSQHAYSVGKMLVYNGILYSVTSAISVGDLLVIGTNIEKKSVDDALTLSHYNGSIATYGGTVDAYKQGRLCYLRVYSLGGTSAIPSASSKINLNLGLPSAYLPEKDTPVTFKYGGGEDYTGIQYGVVKTNGDFSYYRYHNVDDGSFAITYVTAS